MPLSFVSEDIADYLAGVLNPRPGEEDPAERLPDELPLDPSVSAVLFLLSPGREGSREGPTLVLNKRSRRVRQPGDLCCPGGSVHPRADRHLARLLALPGSPLARWPLCRSWKRRHPGRMEALSLLLATALRESLEEMRLNPLRVNFLGPLPPRALALFRRQIFPLAAWVPRQRRFFPNWEVERIVPIPLRRLLDPGRYARYRLRFSAGMGGRKQAEVSEFPCFVHEDAFGCEILWGATFRIVLGFLEAVFGFHMPEPADAPIVSGRLDRRYTEGAR